MSANTTRPDEILLHFSMKQCQQNCRPLIVACDMCQRPRMSTSTTHDAADSSFISSQTTPSLMCFRMRICLGRGFLALCIRAIGNELDRRWSIRREIMADRSWVTSFFMSNGDHEDQRCIRLTSVSLAASLGISFTKLVVVFVAIIALRSS